MIPTYNQYLGAAAIFAAFLFAQYDDNSADWAMSDEIRLAQQEEQAKASREYVARQVCGPGAEHEWVSDKDIVCHPKRGKAYQVAEVK